MGRAKPGVGESADAETRLEEFIAKFDPAMQTRIGSVRAAIRRRLPAANELIYDNYNFFVIGYAATERPSDAFLSIASAWDGVRLCFLNGVTISDPSGLLQGSGKQNRFIRLESADDLKRPEIEALITSAVAGSKATMPASGRGRLIIRSVSAKQRPRRKPDASAPPKRSKT
jgi:hypothetical protein